MIVSIWVIESVLAAYSYRGRGFAELGCVTMGVELASNDLPIFEVEDCYLSDSEAFASVIHVLDGVRMVRSSNNN